MSYKLFLDLDGVLADFEKGVLKFTGKRPREYNPPKTMWKPVSEIDDFYNKLDWMPDGKFLWKSLKPFDPVILTGIPMGDIPWAEQKRKWVNSHLGKDTPLLIKRPRETKLEASIKAFSTEYSFEGKESEWILIDDDLKHMPPWETGGGIFIHHTDSKKTLETLMDILENLGD